MYLWNMISSVPIERYGPYLRKCPDNAVEYLEGLKIFILEIICSIEICWCILGSRCSGYHTSRKWLHEFYSLFSITKFRLGIGALFFFYTRGSALNLGDD
jgi:hypothetical protein